MKLAQIIRPLFLTALGLHALVLFVPTGPSETVVIEDVEVESLAESPTPNGPGVLPVPDPNVKTGGAAETSARPAAPNAAKSPVARPAAVTARRPAPQVASVSRRAAAARVNNTATTSSTGGSTGGTAGQASAPAGGADTNTGDASAAGSSSSTPAASSDTEGSSSLATLDPEMPDPNTENAAGDDGDTSSDRSARNSDLSNPLTVSTLLAKVTQQIPDSLQALADELDDSLTYSADNTDDQSVQQAREAWQATLQRQANVGQIEQIAPAEIDELTQVEYPIESSLKSEGRPLSRCLETDPTPAEIGVLFDASGNIVGEPELLRSTGYSGLNEEIRAIVAAYDDFPSDRASKAYTFEVEVFYDSEACVSLTELKEE
ncbi:MAG: hypothetical protein ACFB16_14405 [Phormidesmis sp.]